ncbi:high mobility group box domain-containing protein, partial [Lentinula raphanica]
YEASLLAVAQSMRDAAKAAENFATAIANTTMTNGLTKGKGKTGDEEALNGKRKRSKKDPNAPKRPASSFFLFQNHIRPKMKEQHPDLPNNELRKLMAEQWNTLPEEQKNHFKQMADELKAVYDEKKEKYNARSPEEVAAADAAAAAAASSSEDDKVTTKPGKAAKAPVPSRKAIKSEPVAHSDQDEDDEDEDEDEDGPRGKDSSEDDEDEEDEEEEEEEEQPPAKKSKTKHNDKPVSKRTGKHN